MKEVQKLFQNTKESNELLKKITALERELYEYKQKLEETQLELSENKTALTALSKNIDNIEFNTKLKILKRLHSQILPPLKEIKSEKHHERIQILAEEAITKLQMFIPFPENSFGTLAILSPMEIRIASMIKDGFKSNDIARLQCISLDTVKTHRGSIRKKLGLKNKRIDLIIYLKNLLDA